MKVGDRFLSKPQGASLVFTIVQIEPHRIGVQAPFGGDVEFLQPWWFADDAGLIIWLRRTWPDFREDTELWFERIDMRTAP